MSIRVELTYDMSKILGVRSFEVDSTTTLNEVVEQTRERFAALGNAADEFEKLTRVAAMAVNGVLVTHRKGAKAQLKDGDRIGFVKAAAGG